MAFKEDDVLTTEQVRHMSDNMLAFDHQYSGKYRKGQKEHGGNMWTMGLKQTIENAEDEVLDMWSYLRNIRSAVQEIEDIMTNDDGNLADNVACSEIMTIINRVKGDKAE